MSVAEISEFLRSWQPSGEWSGSTREGLGRILSGIVAAEPRRFASEGDRFLGLDPTYVRALVSGLRDAAGEKRGFPWEQVIFVCKWAVDQPRDRVLREGASRTRDRWDEDPDWGWARKAIAGLLARGFSSGPLEIPLNLRESVWAILRPLTEDPDPTPEDEAGDGMDPMTLSINTTRGEAMHAVIQYGLWIHRNNGGAGLRIGFDQMPEVQEVLEAHLDPTRDPSLAIRSVYGRWFPQLLLLDRSWATPRVELVFPSDEALREYWAAAWDMYVIACRPYDETFEPLQPVYARAVERIGTARPRWRELTDAEEKLSEHLMVWYWQGRLAFEGENTLLRRFYEKVPASVRRHALMFVGSSLRDTSGDIPLDALERIQRLWSWRIVETRRTKTGDPLRDELSAFGWWFVSGKFDDRWAITELVSALSIARKIDPDHLVLERLAAIARAFPREAIEALRLLVEGDTEGWKILAWRNEVRAIVAAALATVSHVK